MSTEQDTDFAAEKRQKLHDTIQGQNPYVAPGSILTGWVLVAEFVPPTGERTLVRVSSEGLKEWQEMGFLHAALDGSFDEEDEDADS